MRSADRIEQAIRNLTVRPDSEAHEQTLTDLREAHVRYKEAARPRMARTAGLAAAVVVIAVSVVIVFCESAGSVYAIEQTVDAIRGIQVVHILGRDWNDKQIEIWSKVNPDTGLMDYWHVNRIDDEQVIVSTPQNTFSFDEASKTVRIQDGPSVASIFRLGEFFEGMNRLAEKSAGRITYCEVTDPATEQKLLELKMNSPRLEIRSLIDPETKLPLTIDTIRGEGLGSYDTLKHATKISYDDMPPEGVFDFTIPAGASVEVETLEDPLADLPVDVIRYCGQVHQEAIEEKAEPNGIRTNTQIYFVDGQFSLRNGGFIGVTNDSNDIQTGEVGVGNFDRTHLVLFEAASGKKQQIRLVQHRLTSPGRFRLHWNLDEPLRPGRTRRGLYWITDAQKLPEGPEGAGHRLRLSNTFGSKAIENFVLVVPAGIAVYDYSRPYLSRAEVEGYTVYLWQKTLPKERVNNTVDVSLSHSGADYSAEYIERNRGRVLVEIPEVFELANIAIAISEPGLNEQHRVNKQGDYYKRVLEHFLPFKDQALIAEPDLTRNYGYCFRDNSICYAFDGDRLVHGGRYFNVRRPDLFKQQLARVEDFARVSGFRQFYRDNLPYYEQQVNLYRRKVPVRKMWTWLEERFPARHDCYKIVFSPLIGASHETCGFENQDFSETIMFISGPGESRDTSNAIEQGCVSRVVFTEIDHNYVNRITKDHLDGVNEVFADLGPWNQQDGYPSAELTFNEYMTWAVFVLYVYDTYEEEDAEIIVKRSTVDTMVHFRKFIRFQAFADALLRLYRNRADDPSIPDLYSAILDWAESQ